MKEAAVVFVSTQHLLPDAHRCINYCRTQGYSMIGVVKDDWTTALEYITSGKAAVLVVADEQHLDPARTPRIEVVTHGRQTNAGGRSAKGKTRNTRTRIVRRNAGA